MRGPECIITVAMSPYGGRLNEGEKLAIKLNSVIPRIMDNTCTPEKLMAQEEITRDSMGLGNDKWMEKRNPIELNVQPGFSYYPQTVTRSTLYRLAGRLDLEI